MSNAHGIEALARVGRPRILVLGDLILDHYVYGRVDRISPEAPIPVLAVTEEEDRLGGAGNVAANLAALGAEAYLIGLLGDDHHGERYVELSREHGVIASPVKVDDRPTIRKSRCVALSQQVLRIDHEVVRPLSQKQERELLDRALEVMEMVDMVLLSDYAKGVLSDVVLRNVFAKARQRGIRAIVDPKTRNFGRYRGASLIKPNRREAEDALGRPLQDRAALTEGMTKLIDDLDLESVVVTLGPAGIAFAERGAEPGFIEARAQAVFDVSGAGDTVLAVLGLMLAGDRPLSEAVGVANEAGAVVVGKLGTALVTREEIERQASDVGVVDSKRVELPELVELIEALRRDHEGFQVVFTNGCFDLLHPGHVRLLNFAKAQGDLLIVAINSDDSVRRLKGPERPIRNQDERSELLGAFEAVDFVLVFEEDDPKALLRALLPDVLVKGGDWSHAVGQEIVQERGGRVVFFDEVQGQSTTHIVDSIRRAEAAEARDGSNN